MLEKLFTIGRNTFLESIRQPVFVVLLLTGGFVLLFNPSIASFTMDDDNKMMVDMGLSTLLVIGMFIAAFTATGVIWTEVENRTVLTVVSKPVPRAVFVLGKYLGVATALTLAFWILSGLFLLTVRHKVMSTALVGYDWPVILFGSLAWVGALGIGAAGNYLYRWVFTSSFVFSLALLTALALGLVLVINKHWEFQPIGHEFTGDGAVPQGQLLVVMLLVFEALLVLTAVAVAASTRLGQVMTLIITLGVVLLGAMIETLIHPAMAHLPWGQVIGLRSGAAWVLTRGLYFVTPNLQFLWLADALSQGSLIPAAHVGLVSLYALCQIGAGLFLAVALFQTREVG